MKKLLFILLCLPLLIMAQAPQGFTYQGVATDNNGFELQNQTISIQASILSSSATGATVWQETHTTTTDTFGLFNVVIGEGTSTNGGSSATFQEIDWGAASHFMKVEIDVNGGSNYVHVGTSQMMSVPYALYAENANNINMDSISNYLIQDSIFNTAFGGGSGCNYAFPDGLDGEGVIWNLYTAGNYTVPSGKILYITNYYSPNSGADIRIGGEIIRKGASNDGSDYSFDLPLVVNSGQVVSTTHGGDNAFSGILIDVGNVEGVSWSVPISGDYTVPTGKRLYITNYYAENGWGYLSIDGQIMRNGMSNNNNYYSFTLPVVVNAGQVVSGYTTHTHRFNGYLVDENYFANCGGGGFGGSSSTANVSLDYDSLANILANNSAFLSSISPSGKTIFGDFETVSHDLDNNSVYWVPAGKNLEITASLQLGSNANWLYINNKQVNGGSGAIYAPLYASEGQSISGYGSINGRLFDNSNIDPITWDLDNDGNYTVPADMNLAISQLFSVGYGDNIFIDGLLVHHTTFSSTSNKVYASENQTISGNGVINGYLIAKDYFTSALDSSSISSGLDSATVADMIANAMGNSAGSSVPTGVVQAYSGTTAPTGWLLCDGSAVSRTSYPDLFTLIDTTYGSGDGSYTLQWIDSNNDGIMQPTEMINVMSTFNVPDLRGRTIIAADNMGGTSANVVNGANILGSPGGSETHQLTTDEMPTHNYVSSLGSGGGGPPNGQGNFVNGYTTIGNDLPHNNMPPYLIMNYIIKY